MSEQYIANDVIALAGAGVNFAQRPCGIWVDCVKCGRRDRIPDGPKARAMSDERARTVFEAHGWSVRPTFCPDHSGGADR